MLLIRRGHKKPPARETLKRIIRAANAVEDLALVVEDLSRASTWADNVIGTTPNPEIVNKIRTDAKAVAEMAAVVKEVAGIKHHYCHHFNHFPAISFTTTAISATAFAAVLILLTVFGLDVVPKTLPAQVLASAKSSMTRAKPTTAYAALFILSHQ